MRTFSLEDLKKSIVKKFFKLSAKQLMVAQYIVNNIEDIRNINTTTELSRIIGVSTTTLNITLSILNLGSFSTFKNKVKKIIDKNK